MKPCTNIWDNFHVQYVISTRSYYNVILLLSHFTGTKTGMAKVTIRNQGPTFVSLAWGRPKYSPQSYKLRYNCYLTCEKQPYIRREEVISTSFTGMHLTRLKPGSLCTIIVVLVYNPSEVDPGSHYAFETLHSSKAYTCTYQYLKSQAFSFNTIMNKIEY